MEIENPVWRAAVFRVLWHLAVSPSSNLTSTVPSPPLQRGRPVAEPSELLNLNVFMSFKLTMVEILANCYSALEVHCHFTYIFGSQGHIYVAINI